MSWGNTGPSRSGAGGTPPLWKPMSQSVSNFSRHQMVPTNLQGISLRIQGRTPQRTEFIYKQLCVYSYVFKLQSPSKYSPFDTMYLLRLFSTALNSFWICRFWCLLLLLPSFVLPLPHRQNVYLWGLFFSSGETKKSRLRRDQVTREGGTQGSCHFWSKTAEHSAQCGWVGL